MLTYSNILASRKFLNWLMADRWGPHSIVAFFCGSAQGGAVRMEGVPVEARRVRYWCVGWCRPCRNGVMEERVWWRRKKQCQSSRANAWELIIANLPNSPWEKGSWECHCHSYGGVWKLRDKDETMGTVKDNYIPSIMKSYVTWHKWQRKAEIPCQRFLAKASRDTTDDRRCRLGVRCCLGVGRM